MWRAHNARATLDKNGGVGRDVDGADEESPWRGEENGDVCGVSAVVRMAMPESFLHRRRIQRFIVPNRTKFGDIAYR